MNNKFTPKTSINFLPSVEAVWWGTAHSASRAVGDFLLRIDSIKNFDTCNKNNVFVKEKVNGDLKPRIGLYTERVYTHFYNYFDPKDQTKNFFLFCNIRNPYARAASAWKRLNFMYDRSEITTLDTWLSRLYMPHRRTNKPGGLYSPGGLFNITKNIKDVKNVTGKTPDRFLRTENIAEDVKKLPFVNLEDQNILNAYNTFIVNNESKVIEERSIRKRLERNKSYNPNKISPFSSWKTHYNQETADIVYKELEEDFVYFGYSRDSWKEGISSGTTELDLYK